MPSEVQLVKDISEKTHSGMGIGGSALGGGIIGLLLGGLLSGNGGWFGGGGNNATQTAIGLTNEGLALKTQSDLAAAATRTNDNMSAGFSGINNGICGIQQTMCQGFGALTHQIDMGFCDVKETVRNDGNATRALINDIVTQNLRERLSTAENALSNANQTSNIINALRPYPTPSYITSPPNVPFGYGGHGCNPCSPCGGHW